MKSARRFLAVCVSLIVLLQFASNTSVFGQVVFFDTFKEFASGSDLTETNYSPASGPSSASVETSVQNGSPATHATNFLGGSWALFDNSIAPNKSQYKGILSSIQTNQALLVTWKMWIESTNSGPGMFLFSVPVSDSDPNVTFNPPLVFTDTGNIIALTNGVTVQTTIGNWSSLVGTVMTNTLLLDYPNRSFSYSLNGEVLATLPLGPYYTNVLGKIYFNAFERSAGSLGNRFAFTDLKVELGAPTHPQSRLAQRVASTINPDDELSMGMTVDTQGNAYVTGWFDGTNDFGGITLTNSAGGGQDIFIAKYDSTGALKWARRAGSASVNQDTGRGVGVDGAGNVYVTGGFAGAADFGSITLPDNGSEEFFLAKYNGQGVVQWVQQSVGGSEVYGLGLAVDNFGNSFAVGFSDNNAAVTFGSINLTPPSDTGYSSFLVKYDSSGAAQWAQLIGGPGKTYATKIAVDGSGNVYVRGSFTQSIKVGTQTLTTSGERDAFIAKFDPNGSLAWIRQIGGIGANGPDDGGVSVDQNGNVYISGGYEGSLLDFGGGVTLTSGGSWDAFLAKYNSNGIPLWAQRAGDNHLDIYFDIALDREGNVFAAGVLGADSVAPDGSAGAAMIAKYDSSGSLQWSYSALGSPGDPVGSIALKTSIDPHGNAYIAGVYQSALTFGTDVLQPQGHWNFFLSRVELLPTSLLEPPFIISQPKSQTVFPNQQAFFEVTASGTSPLGYQWRHDGTNIPGEISFFLSLNNVQADQSGKYDVVVSNAAGSVTNFPPAVLTVADVGQPGQLIVWGSNDHGQTNVPPELGSVAFVSLGYAHTVAVKTDGTVAAWGAGLFDTGSFQDRDRGQSIVPAGLSNVMAVAAGDTHTLALKKDGTVVAWGANDFGKATVPDSLTGVISIAAGETHSVALKSDGSVVIWGNNGSGQATVPPGLTGVTAIAAGYAHTVVLKSDGTVLAWGYNWGGQINVPDGLSGVKAIAAGGLHTVALKNDGTVIVWGDNSNGQTNVPVGLTGIKAIAAGYAHTVALKNDGSIVSWGFVSSIPIPSQNIKAIAAGGFQTAVIIGSKSASPVQMQILPNDGGFILSWPSSATDYRVESTPSLSPPVTWTNVSGPFQTTADSLSIVLPVPDAQKFYRLARP
jgi:hypothetical protein